jgi:OmcA/MtrC family decaheme c-type cytochrome
MRYGGALFFAGVLALAGCSGEDGDPGAPGSDGADGTTGPTGATGPTGPAGQDLTATAKPESCAVCHGGAGASHQAIYNQYTDTSTLAATIGSVTSDPKGTTPETYDVTVAFSLTKNGVPYDANISSFGQKTVYVTQYDPTTGQFPQTTQLTALTSLGEGNYTAENTSVLDKNGGTPYFAYFDPLTSNAMVYAYFAENPTLIAPKGHYKLYDNLASAAKVIGTVDYASTANVAGCEKCHGAPYLKHGHRAAKVAGLPDFVSCKACHYDTRDGHSQTWQCLVDDPAAYAAGTCETKGEYASYAYKAKIMNDTHMSHAMEFAYPQTMANCVTCHEGKLDRVLTAANFTLATCKSCHPVTGVGGTDSKRAPALLDIMPDNASHAEARADLYNFSGACNTCHSDASATMKFAAIHRGSHKLIYAVDGTKYSAAFTTAISDASLTGTTLAFKVTVTESTDLAGLAASDVMPTAYIAPYGYGTKDFILAAKNQKLAVATPAAGWTVTPETATATTMSWAVTADLAVVGGTTWTDRITNNSVNRVELAVLPFLPNLDGVTYLPHNATTPATAPVALNAVTKTFDLDANAFGAANPIVDVNKCNACHDALGTTFHTADRGGNVVMCRVCHVPLSPGSHLELQSRSIDSYVHAIHSMQPFDIGDVEFDQNATDYDPVAVLHVEHHEGSTYPNFTLLNCESCHFAGTYEVPDQSKSLPGLLSKSDVVFGRGLTVASYVTGPASRACGSCHRAGMLNEKDVAGIAAFNSHTESFGYMIDATTNGSSILTAAIDKILGMFQ